MQSQVFINPESIFMATVLDCLFVTVPFLLVYIFLYLRELPLLNSEPLLLRKRERERWTTDGSIWENNEG